MIRLLLVLAALTVLSFAFAVLLGEIIRRHK